MILITLSISRVLLTLSYFQDAPNPVLFPGRPGARSGAGGREQDGLGPPQERPRGRG